MKYYVQYQVLSTGYVEGSIPPKFDDNLKKPIDKLGSDGVSILDGRFNLHNMIIEAKNRISKILYSEKIISFKIIKAESFSDEGKTIYQHKNLF